MLTSEAIFEDLQLQRIVDDIGTIAYVDENGQLHRNFGPAAIWRNGMMVWYHHGKPHRLNGPAQIRPESDEVFWIHGITYSKEDYWKEVENLKQGTDVGQISKHFI